MDLRSRVRDAQVLKESPNGKFVQAAVEGINRGVTVLNCIEKIFSSL